MKNMERYRIMTLVEKEEAARDAGFYDVYDAEKNIKIQDEIMREIDKEEAVRDAGIDDVIEFLIPFFEQKENSIENLKLLLTIQLKKLYEQAYNKGYELGNRKT